MGDNNNYCHYCAVIDGQKSKQCPLRESAARAAILLDQRRASSSSRSSSLCNIGLDNLGAQTFHLFALASATLTCPMAASAVDSLLWGWPLTSFCPLAQGQCLFRLFRPPLARVCVQKCLAIFGQRPVGRWRRRLPFYRFRSLSLSHWRKAKCLFRQNLLSFSLLERAHLRLRSLALVISLCLCLVKGGPLLKWIGPLPRHRPLLYRRAHWPPPQSEQEQ